MYDLAEVRAATDSWWEGLARAFTREGLKDIPRELDRGGDYRGIWSRPDLLLSQTCGYPLTHSLRAKVTVVATPHYRAKGCGGPHYASTILVHADAPGASLDDFRGMRCALSSSESQSGFSALRHAVAPLARDKPFFKSIVMSGGHLNSIEMITKGEVDIAAVDCVTLALVERHCPARLAAVRPLCLTGSAPGLPYITGIASSEDSLKILRAGLDVAFHDPSLADCRAALLIDGLTYTTLADYARIDEMEREAIGHGYTVVR